MTWRRAIVLSAGAALFAGAARGADPPPASPADPQKIDLSQIISSMGMSMPVPSPESGGLPDFAQVTKDMISQAGLFTLWHYPPGARDKDPEKVLCQIPAGFLGEKFMLSTSFAGGGFFTGFPIDERVVQWELLGNQLLLLEPESRYVIDPSAEVADVVRRTYPETIRRAIPLVTKSPAGDPVIDLGALLKSDFADIAWMSFFAPMGLGGAGAINPALSKWSEKKAFELNVEIGVELAIGRMSPPGSYDKKMVHFSFWRLPRSDYRPRIADDRVGYFLTANQDWSKPTEARDLFNRYIDRWHLVKRDPKLALCEPRQPIVFYIEKTVPVRFRRAVHDGIWEWNKAYEKVGFSNAVVVRQQTDDNEWKDLDPEDMRYSFFRWIVTGAGFAMGPHRANPFTGQIYDADIIFDDSMVRYFEQEAERLLPAAATAMKAGDPALERFLDHFPQWRRAERPWEQFVFGDRADDLRVRDAVRRRLYEQGRHFCEYADGMKHQMMLAHAVLADKPPEVREQFLYDVIKEVVMHEVGHTLGLRHNFKASSIWTLDEIKARRKAGQATTGSVMDYNPALLFADGSTDGRFLTPTIGPYDEWAIEYGYRPFDGQYKGAERPAPAQPAQTEAPAAAAPASAAAGSGGVSGPPASATLDQIPPEVLQQIPPEMRERVLQMIQSGAFQQMAASATAGQAPPAPPAPAGPAGPAFQPAASGEEGMLRQIAGRATEPALAYATDEDTTFFGPDPRTWRFDVASDPVAWARDRTELVEKRLAQLRDWAVRDQESWYHLRNEFLTLMFEKVLVLEFVGRYIGGQYFSRAHKGDPGAPAPFVLVEPAVQRDAMAFIESSLYGDEFFSVEPDLLNHLAPPRWWHWGATVSYTLDFPIYDLIGVFQWWNLFDRLVPNTLRRIQDAELKSDATDRFTAAEYIQRLRDAVWSGTVDATRYQANQWSDSRPYVSGIRRSLQREYLGLVEPLVRARPGTVLSPDLHAMLSYSLEQLSAQIDKVLSNGKLDFASEAHLKRCASRIDRMLEPELQESGAAPGLMMGF